ncbi:MAG: hypothetical protein ACI4HK_05830 [Ruminococcus sp.]
MNYVLVQIAKRYLCITACEAVGEAAANGSANKANPKKQADPNEKKAYSFSSPLIIPVDKAVLKDKSSVWEDPALLARLVKDGLSQMNHSEVKDVVLMVESYDLTCQEYQHIRGAKKVLEGLAIDRIKDFVGDAVSDFTVIYKDYSAFKTKEVNEEITSKAFAMPKALADDLVAGFKSFALNLIRIIPSEAAMIYSAQKTVYSFNKTVALISMDYSAVRVLIAKDGVPLYCHDFASPVDEILQVIEEDRDLGTAAAIDYLRTAGYGFKEECRNASSQRKIEDISESLIDDIIRNIRLVTMSLNIRIDQIFLSDFIAYIPHIRNYVAGLNLAGEVMLISDTFNTGSVVPEPSLKARDDFYKSGSYFLMNELMNDGTVFEDNLIYGLKAQQAKTLDQSGKVAKAGAFGLGFLCICGVAFFGFFFGRSVIDNIIVNDTKYDYAKTLVEKRDKITEALQNQSQDAGLLPRTQLYCEDVINQLDDQVVKKMDSFTSYSISHTSEGDESYSIPINGDIKNFPTFIDLQNSIKNDGYFSMNENFSVADNSDTGKYSLTAQLATSKALVDARNAANNADKTETTEK